MKYFMPLLALPALILPAFAAPVAKTDLVAPGPSESPDKPIAPELGGNLGKGTMFVEDTIDSLRNIETGLETTIGFIHGDESYGEHIKIDQGVLSDLLRATHYLEVSRPKFVSILDECDDEALVHYARTTADAVGNILVKVHVFKTVEAHEGVNATEKQLLVTLFDDLNPIFNKVDGLKEQVIGILSFKDLPPVFSAPALVHKDDLLPPLFSASDMVDEDDLHRRTAESEMAHDGLELLAERLKTFTAHFDKHMADLSDLTDDSGLSGGMVFSTWLRTMTREADDLTTLLNHSTKDLGTVAKEFAEAKKYKVSNLDKLQYELRTEVVEVVGDVGTVLEKMITAWHSIDMLVDGPLHALLNALWPILRSFDSSEGTHDVLRTLQATMEPVWNDVHPMAVEILSDLERDTATSGKKCDIDCMIDKFDDPNVAEDHPAPKVD